ncbi:Mce protein [Mycolicibacterium mengxianglii]|uniref:Mce protein n=1 Tax=Mycolicibacterium mengxianglii TaxID=2736649 RepID=UPI0018EF20D7|nr:Mce protein [Mycolicibacterium mengxianglii]
MADDAAAPEGKLSGPPTDPDSPQGATESPTPTDQDASSVTDGAGPEHGETAEVDQDGLESADVTASEVVDAEDADAPVDVADAPPVVPREPMSPVKLATIIGLVVVLALGATVGWLGYRAAESRKLAEQRSVFLQVGRQAALNLTTIDAATVDADVQRILDSATDAFYDDFSSRTQPFVEVVRQAQSKSVGEVTSAGLESEDDGGAQVLVAITVKTSNAGAPEQEPRAWRMRISVKQVDDDTKVSNVEFVP